MILDHFRHFEALMRGVIGGQELWWTLLCGAGTIQLNDLTLFFRFDVHNRARFTLSQNSIFLIDLLINVNNWSKFYDICGILCEKAYKFYL